MKVPARQVFVPPWLNRPAKPRPPVATLVFHVFGPLLLVLLSAGCSSFHRDWSRLADQSPPPGAVEGRWEGTWLSHSNGHHGKLRCLLSRRDDSHFEARFWATYGKVFRYTYTVPLEFQSHDTGWEFSGAANLGKLAGGEYFYEGRATATNLFSTYRAAKDHGIFQLRRPE